MFLGLVNFVLICLVCNSILVLGKYSLFEIRLKVKACSCLLLKTVWLGLFFLKVMCFTFIFLKIYRNSGSRTHTYGVEDRCSTIKLYLFNEVNIKKERLLGLLDFYRFLLDIPNLFALKAEILYDFLDFAHRYFLIYS